MGGAENMLKRLIEADAASMPNTAVVSLRSLGVIGKSLQNQGVKVHALHLLPTGFNIFPVMWRLIKLIRRLQPDIVQTWMYHADLLGGVAAYLGGCKNIAWGIRTFSLSDNSKATVLIMKICAALSCWIPKKIIFNSVLARQAHIEAGYASKGMIVIPNGFDFTQFSATQEQRIALRLACDFKEDELVVGCVGRFHADKGQDNFIKAAAIVTKQYETIRFLLVGRDCDIKNTQLIDLLNRYDLIERFVLLGERNDIPDCLAAMDIFCMPSRTEAFPNGLGEAMTMGLPCVATSVGDTAVLTGDTVILVPPQNEQALAEGLLQVIALPVKLRLQMGQVARERVINEFSIVKAHARFDAVYQQILENTKYHTHIN
jgi:glycosyltransferase involved in cell wall biosynthesis